MAFVAYTSAPHVSFVHLALPAFARRSREAALNYVNNLPPTATLYLTTMRFNTMPRQTSVRLGELVADKNPIRPVSFRHTNPAPRPWWMHKAPTQFYTPDVSRPGRKSSAFYPEFWPKIFARIQSQSTGRSLS
ncbi:hypothetical protein N7470_010349 [Penicillium chermesinum]|nr:hypothetical protein N7470_010349 [Penicillium chermesinum]